VREGDTLIAKNADSKEMLWQKLFDAQGKLIQFQTNGVTFKFAPDKSKQGFFVITRITEKGSSETSVPKTIFDNIVGKL
jgi:hypothetical protein